jgi:hypothetical protein
MSTAQPLVNCMGVPRVHARQAPNVGFQVDHATKAGGIPKLGMPPAGESASE